MKKLAGPVTLLALLGAASVADARSTVVGARVNPNPAAVRAYWTPERMANAVPADVVRGGPASTQQGKPSGGGTATWTNGAVTWPATINITYTNGKVYFTDSGVNYVCSGTAVNSANQSVVWTAGHCVHDGPGDFHTNWSFVPAYNSGKSLGTWVAEQLYTTAGWAASGDFGVDLGAAVVPPNGSGTRLTGAIGFARTLGFSPSYTTGTGHRLDAYGYPAAGKFTGQKLWHCDSYLQYVDTSSTPNTMGIPCNMTGGSSGGAWLDASGNQVSVNSYTYYSLKNVMFGPAQGSAAQQLLQTAESTTP